MNDETIEQEIQAKGMAAPRVTPADIEAEITSEHYFTAFDGVFGSKASHPYGNSPCPTELGLLTFCVLALARQKAVEKIWPLLGFRLRDKLSGGAA